MLYYPYTIRQRECEVSLCSIHYPLPCTRGSFARNEGSPDFVPRRGCWPLEGGFRVMDRHRWTLLAAAVLGIAAGGACSSGDSRALPARAGAQAAANCQARGQGEVRDLQLAACLALAPPLKPLWRQAGANRPVVLYFDRSKSMRGFLDPAYPSRTPTDYRSVIDGLVVGLSPAAGYSFGSSVRKIEASLGVLGNKDFYSDADTQLEDALARIATDTALGSSYVIVTDGRRTNPNTANEQYVRMRTLAEHWVGRGGTFLVGTSQAPFKPVPGDPSECRSAPGVDPAKLTCPLYSFAFVAPGDDGRIAGVIAERFQHLFMWPLPAIAPTDLTLVPGGSQPEVQLERRWTKAPDGTPVVRLRGRAVSRQMLAATISLSDTTTPLSHAEEAALSGERLELKIASRSLIDGADRQPWVPVTGAAAHVIPAADGATHVQLRSRGADTPRYLYKVELVPAGVPTWLDAFDASDAHDAIRTYGLARLFEVFRTQAMQGAPAIGRIYIVAN